MQTRLIGLVGRAGVGKDTVADMLARYRTAPAAAPEPNMPDGSTFTPRFAPGSRKKQPAG